MSQRNAFCFVPYPGWGLATRVCLRRSTPRAAPLWWAYLQWLTGWRHHQPLSPKTLGVSSEFYLNPGTGFYRPMLHEVPAARLRQLGLAVQPSGRGAIEGWETPSGVRWNLPNPESLFSDHVQRCYLLSLGASDALASISSISINYINYY